jgi:hypothetical protein
MGRGFLGPRGMPAQPAGEENEPAVAGGRSSRATRGDLRSDMPHRDRSGRALRNDRRDREWWPRRVQHRGCNSRARQALRPRYNVPGLAQRWSHTNCSNSGKGGRGGGKMASRLLAPSLPLTVPTHVAPPPEHNRVPPRCSLRGRSAGVRHQLRVTPASLRAAAAFLTTSAIFLRKAGLKLPRRVVDSKSNALSSSTRLYSSRITRRKA